MNRFTCTAILTLLFSLCITISCSQNQHEQQSAEAANYHVEEESIPLIYHMSFISRYAKKLYFAGEAENWELADIYNHEIEEISEGIVESGEMHDGINISGLMESILLPQIEQLEEAIDIGDREMFLDR